MAAREQPAMAVGIAAMEQLARILRQPMSLARCHLQANPPSPVGPLKVSGTQIFIETRLWKLKSLSDEDWDKNSF